MPEKPLKNYTLIETEDGSNTLFSKSFNEACHSTSGASSETQLHYIKGCQIEELSSQHSPLYIFEVGFGTGLGFIETLNTLQGKTKFIFTSVEIDRELVEHFSNSSDFKLIKEENDLYRFNSEDVELKIYIGDARESIKKIDHKYHAIYQDAFSPKRNANLWTCEWFSDLKNIAHPDCIMSTYSASSSIRKSMIAGGWKLYTGDKFGTKRSSTRAKLTGETDPEIIAKLERSPAPLLTDKNSKEYIL